MITARARIGIQNASIDYSGKVTVFCFGPPIKIIGTMTDISLDIELFVDKNLAVTVNKFGVSNDGELKLEIQNIENFDYLSEKVGPQNQRFLSIESTFLNTFCV